MNQNNWTYRDRFGTSHLVGVMHGADTGHLMIHWNNNVIKVDFDVFEQKRYNVFIGDELCYVEVVRKGKDLFEYTFEIDKETSTPLNDKRKEEKDIDRKKDNIVKWFIGVFAILVSISIGVIFFLKR